MIIQNDIEGYCPELLQDVRIKDALLEAFPQNHEDAMAKFLKEEYKGIGGDVHDLITELIHNESTVVDSFEGQGCAGEFPITIYQFGPLFWVNALEFDDVGYFDTADEAMAYACEEWSSYM